MKIFLTCILILLVSGCSLEKMGASAGKGVASETDSIGNNLVRGAVAELTDPRDAKKNPAICRFHHCIGGRYADL